MLKLPRAVLLGLLFASASVLASPKHVFNFRIQGEPSSFDWNVAGTMTEANILLNIMDGLVTVDASLVPRPALAQSWARSKDGTTYTFKLRHDVKWSDGVPLKAKDFVFGWKRLLSPELHASYAYFLFDIHDARAFHDGSIKDFSQVGVKALDDFTLQVKLDHPTAYWIYLPAFWVTFPVREDIVRKFGANWAKPGNIVTLGPYTVIEHDVDSKVVLAANPRYYGKRGNVDQAVGWIVKDEPDAMKMYDQGKLDYVTDISVVDAQLYMLRNEARTFPLFTTVYMGFVTKLNPVSDLRVRRAIAMAIDLSKVPGVQMGLRRAGSFVPPPLLGSSAEVGLRFDPVEARKELLQAGINTSRNPLNLELLTWNSDKRMAIATFVQRELKQNLNIDVTIVPFDTKEYYAEVVKHSRPLFLGGWSADYPDPDNFLSVFLGGGGNNQTTWGSAAYDKKVVEAREVHDLRSRMSMYLDLQKTLQERAAILVPLYYDYRASLIKPRVHDFEADPLDYLKIKHLNVTP